MKQFGLAFIQYAQDYDEKLPRGSETTYGTGAGWGSQLYPYLKSSQIFSCPSDSGPPDAAISAKTSRMSYAANAAALGDTALLGNPSANSALAKFNATAKTVMMCEVSRLKATVDAGQESGEGLSPTTTGLDERIFSAAGNVIAYGTFATGFLGGRGGTIGTTASRFEANTGRHLDGSNFLMADGHVKWLRGEKVSSGWMASAPNSVQAGAGPSGTSAGTEDPAFAVTFSPM